MASLIRDDGKIERYGMITVLPDEFMLKIGHQKNKPEDLPGPFMAFRYSLDLARIATRNAGYSNLNKLNRPSPVCWVPFVGGKPTPTQSREAKP